MYSQLRRLVGTKPESFSNNSGVDQLITNVLHKKLSSLRIYMQNLLSALQNDLLAVIVLIALVFAAVISIYFIFKANYGISSNKGYKTLLPLLSLLGFPAALDLIQTTGNIKFFAIFIFIILVVNLLLPTLEYLRKTPVLSSKNWVVWSTPIFVSAGLVVAGYLTYVEATAHLVECGVAIPGCVSVQTSSYAKLFGFFPIALLGVVGYIVILATWILQKFVAHSKKDLLSLVLWGVCMFGVLFSTYLTYLEAFVIHATCSWCILSAVLMILLLWVSTPNAQNYFYESETEN